jgi:hypothetical protein
LGLGVVLRVLSLVMRRRLSSDLSDTTMARCSLVGVGVGRSRVGKRHTVTSFFGVISPVVGQGDWSLRSFLPEKSSDRGCCLGRGGLRGHFPRAGRQPRVSGPVDNLGCRATPWELPSGSWQAESPVGCLVAWHRPVVPCPEPPLCQSHR